MNEDFKEEIKRKDVSEENSKSQMRKYMVMAIIFVTIMIVLGVVGSYAYFKVNVSNTTTTANITGTAECMDIEFAEVKDGAISSENLTYSYPITDDWAKEHVKPFKLTITNKCKQTSEVNYALVLTTLSKDEDTASEKTYLNDSQLRLQVKKDGQELKSADYINSLKKVDSSSSENDYQLLQKELTEKLTAAKKTYSDYKTINSYILDSSTIKNNTDGTSKIEYDVYLWVDYYEGDSAAYNGTEHNSEQYDNTTENKHFESLITLIVNPNENKPNS